MKISKDSQSEIVIKQSQWIYVGGWGILLFGLLFFIGYLPSILADLNSETLIPTGFGLFFVLLGIWIVGWTTKVTFDKPPGYLTVSRGNWPLFLWFLRTKRFSRQEVKSVFAYSRDPWWWTYEGSDMHEVRAVANSGKEVILCNVGWKHDIASYLANRIENWANEAVVTN